MAVTKQAPVAATVLVGAGLIPFAAGALGLWVLPPAMAAHALDAQVFYGVTVLAFLGAVHWGAVFAAGPTTEATLWRRLGWGVVPALVAWMAALMTAVPAVLTLMAGLGASYAVDRWAGGRGELPDWYLGLRRRATAVALLCLGVSLLRLV